MLPRQPSLKVVDFNCILEEARLEDQGWPHPTQGESSSLHEYRYRIEWVALCAQLDGLGSRRHLLKFRSKQLFTSGVPRKKKEFVRKYVVPN